LYHKELSVWASKKSCTFWKHNSLNISLLITHNNVTIITTFNQYKQ
jgi:hypothetical protein